MPIITLDTEIHAPIERSSGRAGVGRLGKEGEADEQENQSQKGRAGTSHGRDYSRWSEGEASKRLFCVPPSWRIGV